MYNENPCSLLRQAHRQFAALGVAEFGLRSMFSDDDDAWTSRDRTIAQNLDTLEDLQLIAAQKLLTAKRRHDAWLRKQRDDAAKQVADAD